MADAADAGDSYGIGQWHTYLYGLAIVYHTDGSGRWAGWGDGFWECTVVEGCETY